MRRTVDTNGTASSLSWSERLLTLDDLRPHLTVLRELVVDSRTIVSPLVLDELRDRKILLRRGNGAAATSNQPRTATTGIGYALESPDGVADSVAKALERDGFMLDPWTPQGSNPASWAWSLGLLVREQRQTGVAFVSDPCLTTCIAGKVAGVRAVNVASAIQVARALAAFRANLFILETPGRTFFEIKQIVKAAATGNGTNNPEVERIFQEVDGHAHR